MTAVVNVENSTDTNVKKGRKGEMKACVWGGGETDKGVTGGYQSESEAFVF